MDNLQKIIRLAERGIKSHYKQDIVGLFIGIGLGLLFFILSFLPPIRNIHFVHLFIIIISFSLILLFVSLFFISRQIEKKHHKLLQELQLKTGKIIWVYLIIDINIYDKDKNGIRYQICVNMIDGSRCFIVLPNEEAQELMRLMRKEFTDVTFGYSKVIKKQYIKNRILLQTHPQIIDEIKYRYVRG